MHAPSRPERIDAEGILVLAPIGRDAPLLVATLAEAGVTARACRGLDELAAQLDEGFPDAVGALIIAEEALDTRRTGPLLERLARQPAWSDLPIIVVTNGSTSRERRLLAMEAFGPAANVTLLERPFQALTLVSTARSALRMRMRQYEVRDHVRQQALSAEALASKAAELERSNAELEQFAAVASHDLQEPLRMITSYLAILQRRYAGTFDAKAGEYFGFVTDGAHRMRAMIDAILEYSKVGQGLALETVDSTASLGDALDALDVKLKATGATITADSLPAVRSNRVLLSQVFQNLIANAVKFCEREPAVAITAREQPDAWVFSVADNGIGIPAEGQERLFKIFQRLHAPDRYHGTGIGLATCRKIVDIHGGRIWIESTVDVGSTFHFSLPK